MMEIRYLLDEHANPRIRRAVIREEPSLVVRCLGDPGVPRRGSADQDILAWCERSGCILVTNNRATKAAHLTQHLAAGRNIPGIFVFDSTMSIGQVAEELVLIATTTLAEEHVNIIRYLPYDR
jgi:hypothetical protein